MADPLRILFLADSHLGFDLPERPRVARRRRGEDFLANHAAALAPARRGEVDLVVHGGDVFDRPQVPASLAYQAYAPLLEVAERGIPVFIVPGNHERSRLPHVRFAAHPRVHVFDRPRTFRLQVRGAALGLSGFPYERRSVRTRFRELLEQTGWREDASAARLLCVHHCAEGATVGPGDFTFTTAADVIRPCDVPEEFAAVLSGHIHRYQVLMRDLRGRPLRVPVFYPGSIERTSLAEAGERKGYLRLALHAAEPAARVTWSFHELPARPMIVRELKIGGLSAQALDTALQELVRSAPVDAVLRVRVKGDVPASHAPVLAAARLRRLAPPAMNLEVTTDTFLRRTGEVRDRRTRTASSAAGRSAPPDPQLGLLA
ncbi:MAG TPA: metallophosphoesterase [Longimicrobiales bacterium]|nr:metallophosphoesterase [Longimicrobiales bacterium]